jgi:arylsulfatase/arylsulfatase A
MMRPEERTLGEVWSEAGYATGIFGKWHLGDCAPMRPQDQGFGEVLVHRGGGLAQPSEPPANDYRYTNPILFHNGREVQTQGYCTDVYVDYALEFIDASAAAGRPFLACVTTNAPHGPFQDVPLEAYNQVKKRWATAGEADFVGNMERELKIAAMIENIDRNVGRMLQRLEERGQLENTIFVFLGDNGPVGGRPAGALRGHKASVYEGGIRSPLWIRWAGELRSTTRISEPMAHVDLLPTLAALCGIEAPAEVDGSDFSGALRGEGDGALERWLVLQSHRGNRPAFEHHFAVVGDRWKLVRASGFGRNAAPEDVPFELFDLSADPGETNDVAGQHPEVVGALRAVYERWYADVTAGLDAAGRPPRILVGSAAEPETHLTLQDCYYAEGEGWRANSEGRWLLEVPVATRFDVELRFREPVELDSVRLWTDTDSETREGQRSGDRIPIGELELAAGPVDLGFDLSHAGEEVPLFQVVLKRR